MIKGFLNFTVCTVLAALAVRPALAQNAPQSIAPAPNAALPAQAAASAPSPDAGQPGILQDIIVTAQRRGENIQSVPISINALTADQLQAGGGRSSEDLTALVPALVYNPGAGGGQLTIRGIGGTNSGVDSGNAVYVDGVYHVR